MLRYYTLLGVTVVILLFIFGQKIKSVLRPVVYAGPLYTLGFITPECEITFQI